MKYSDYYIPTLKEEPSEAEIISHALCLRSGLIRKIASGIYSFLPLGFEVLKKIENIVREEMNKAGAIELMLPVMQPSDLWVKSERWFEYGPEMFRLKDRNKRDFCLGPTHEELITYLAYLDIKSYRDLPINLYQIQVKFRDEIRPRFGLLRAREFIMKDAYSFCENEKQSDEIYQKMYQAYCKILQRMGLKYKVVEAETGLIGGKYSHEFIVMAKSGEEKITICPDCGYAANYQMANFVSLNEKTFKEDTGKKFDIDEIKEVYTPGITTVEKLAKFLKRPVNDIVKTILLKDVKNKIYAFLVSGERKLNLAKTEKFLNLSLEIVKEQKLSKNLNIGFLGPVNLNNSIKIFADRSVKGKINFITGANKKDYHLINVNYPRDFSVADWGDFSYPVTGDRCIHCGKELSFEKGIEIGHIFKLGEKYSIKLEANFLDKDGFLKPFVMGCYGIGISRIISAAIEQLHDEKGIVWPPSIAPFMINLIVTNVKNEKLIEESQKIYHMLESKGIEVLYDDRNVSAGVKFKDSDLLGIPIKFIVGRKFLEEKKVEVEYRNTGEKEDIAFPDLLEFAKKIINSYSL